MKKPISRSLLRATLTSTLVAIVVATHADEPDSGLPFPPRPPLISKPSQTLGDTPTVSMPPSRYRTEEVTRYVEEKDGAGNIIRRPVVSSVFVPFYEPIPQPTHPFPGNQVMELRSRYSRTDDVAERENLKAKLKETLATEFEKMHQGQADEIREMRERLEKVESLHEKRAANRDAIIERRIEELIGTPPDLRWNPQSSQNPSFSRPNNFQSREWTKENPLVPPIPDASTVYPNSKRPTSESPTARIFDVHRSLTERQVALEAATQSRTRIKRLHEQGMTPVSQVNQIEAEVKRLTALIVIDQKELQFLYAQTEQELSSLRGQLSNRTNLSREKLQDLGSRAEQVERTREAIRSWDEPVDERAGESQRPTDFDADE